MQMASSQGAKRNEIGMKWDELDPQSCWQAHGHEIENRTRLVCVSALSHWPLVEESLLWQQREGSSSDTACDRDLSTRIVLFNQRVQYSGLQEEISF